MGYYVPYVMAPNNANTTEAQTPISDSAIEYVANRHDIARSDVRAVLDRIQGDIGEYELVDDFDSLHEFIGERDGVRVYLTQHATEVDELAGHASGAVGVEFPDFVGAPQVVREAFDREAKQRFADLFGGQDDAVGATGHADALIVRESND